MAVRRAGGRPLWADLGQPETMLTIANMLMVIICGHGCWHLRVCITEQCQGSSRTIHVLWFGLRPLFQIHVQRAKLHWSQTDTFRKRRVGAGARHYTSRKIKSSLIIQRPSCFFLLIVSFLPSPPPASHPLPSISHEPTSHWLWVVLTPQPSSRAVPQQPDSDAPEGFRTQSKSFRTKLTFYLNILQREM